MFLDERCLLFAYDNVSDFIHGVQNYRSTRTDFYIASNLVPMFDINHISNKMILEMYVQFLALNNGFKVFPHINKEFDEDSGEYYDHFPNVKFVCSVGNYLLYNYEGEGPGLKKFQTHQSRTFKQIYCSKSYE